MNISLDTAQALLEALKRNPAEAQLRNTPNTGTATVHPSHSRSPEVTP